VRRLLFLFAVALLAFVPAAHATLVFNRGAANVNPTVWAADDDGSNQHQLAKSGLGPRVSPDGLTVAYQSLYSNNGDQQLIAVPAAGGKRSILLEPQWNPDVFAWSPDSKTIAAVTGREIGTKRLVLIDVASGATRTVANGQFYGVSFSPSGGAVVYSRAPTDNSYPPHASLWVAPTTGGKPVRITHGHSDVQPLWGPQSVVFARERKATRRFDAPKQDLYLISPSDGAARRLTTTRPAFLLYGLSPVSWSDDGSRLLAQFGGQDTAYAQTVDPATGTVRTVGHLSDGIVGSELSHDGSTILATSGVAGDEPSDNTDVVAIPYAGGRPTVLARRAFSPDWTR
jgi:Tol biopolymer transport system component